MLVPRHLVEHEQHVQDFLLAHEAAKQKKKRRRNKQKKREIHFMKLTLGEWGISGPRDLVRPGQTVTVVKKNGTTCTEVVWRIISRDAARATATIIRRVRQVTPSIPRLVQVTAPRD